MLWYFRRLCDDKIPVFKMRWYFRWLCDVISRHCAMIKLRWYYPIWITLLPTGSNSKNLEHFCIKTNDPINLQRNFIDLSFMVDLKIAGICFLLYFKICNKFVIACLVDIIKMICLNILDWVVIVPAQNNLYPTIFVLLYQVLYLLLTMGLTSFVNVPCCQINKHCVSVFHFYFSCLRTDKCV